MSMQGRIGRAGGVKVKRGLGVQAILEWAFRVEKAQLELPLPKDVSEEGFGFGMEYVLLQRGALGCKVDGGQHKKGSYTSADAEVAAATLAGMPDSLGGKRMAIYVAELARGGMTPDWMPSAVPRCVPVEAKTNQHGEWASKGRNSLDAAALVWSNAPVIIGAHDTGPLIRSTSGFWLAIPLPAAGKAMGGKRITPAMWEKKTGLRLRFVYRSRGPSLLVADAVRLNTRSQAAVSKSKTGRGQVTAPIFLLVRQAKLPKRLNLARDAERAQAAIPGSIVRNWVNGRTGH